MDYFWRKKILWLLFSNSGHKLNFSEKFWGAKFNSFSPLAILLVSCTSSGKRGTIIVILKPGCFLFVMCQLTIWIKNAFFKRMRPKKSKCFVLKLKEFNCTYHGVRNVGQNFLNISYSMIRTRTCAYQEVRNARFSKKII